MISSCILFIEFMFYELSKVLYDEYLVISLEKVEWSEWIQMQSPFY